VDLARVSLIGLGITPPQPFNALGINFDLGLAQRLVGEQASLMPILRWMRQTESSMPSASSGNPRLHRQPPAETDMQEYFCVSPPSVHQMVLTLERAGLIRRQPRTPRSIEVLVDPRNLPELLSPRPTCQLVALHRGFDRLRRQFSGCTAPAHPSLACGVDALKQRLYDIGRKFLEELDREDRPRYALLKPRPPPRTASRP
jgi:hypothetical protein